ncbi:MAG: alpha-E domain-containing protein, partial [Actinomycetota bacterium]
MLGRTAGGLYWMFRYLERSENTARLIEAGMRIALTSSSDLFDEWDSVLSTAGQRETYVERHDEVEPAAVIDFLLRDQGNPSSVRSVVELARNNAREVRTALTREVWEATNATWLAVADALRRPVSTRDLPRVLSLIRQESAYWLHRLYTWTQHTSYTGCTPGPSTTVTQAVHLDPAHQLHRLYTWTQHTSYTDCTPGPCTPVTPT